MEKSGFSFCFVTTQWEQAGNDVLFPFAVKNAGAWWKGVPYHTADEKDCEGGKEALALRKKLVLERGKKGWGVLSYSRVGGKIG